MIRWILISTFAALSLSVGAQQGQSLGPGYACELDLQLNNGGRKRLKTYITEPIVSASTSGQGESLLIVESAGPETQILLDEQALFEYRVPGIHVSAADGNFYLILAHQDSGEWEAKGFLRDQHLSGYCLFQNNVIRQSEAI